MQSAAPSQKVTASSLAMTATTILVWVLNHYLIPGDPLPGDISAVIVTFVGSAVAYMTPPSKRDVATMAPAPPDAGTP